MPLKEQLAGDLKDALRSGDQRRRDTLRLLLSAVHNAKIAAGSELDDAGVQAVVQKEARQRRESIEEFRKGGRQDLVDKEEAELAVLSGYLPEQLDRSQIEQAARKVIDDVGARGPGDLGRVMPKLMEELRGRADGREVNAVVRELLQNQ